MVYTEVVTLKNRHGKTIESVCDSFDNDVVADKKTVVRNMNGRTIIYDFNRMTAQFWRSGNPEGRKTSNIIVKNL